ncbi:DUF4882 family protein [Acinetobacter bereziniae]|uniref:DUF4882 family protein n=1 Tax=Acinetobacter bereziniae TaxID=106648 RepID=UPI002954CA38|nr:DUF4882 family protein [Acinetobacter bereziniae]MDV8155097.1 DUF4882 family protein [Acinetobacter bereziniae]
MRKLIMILLTGLINVNVWATSCNYNFNATQPQLGTQRQSFPIHINQKVGFNITDSTLTKTYTAFSKEFLESNSNKVTIGDKNVPKKGIFAFEVDIIAPQLPMSGSDSGYFLPFIIYVTANGVETGRYYISYINNFVSFPNSNNIILDFGSENIAIIPASKSNIKLGFYFDQTTKNINYIVDGINKGVLAKMEGEFNEIAFGIDGGQSEVQLNSNSIGKQFTIELVTDYTKMTQSYPICTKDICGNII